MDSIKPMPGPATPATPTSGAPTAKVSGNYETDSLREVQARANHVRHGETPTERRGMRRLNEAMTSGQDLRRDVPRGFYLNITV